LLLKKCLLADIALQALHPTGIKKLTKDTKYQLRVRRFFAIMSQKSLPPMAVNQKHPPDLGVSRQAFALLS
jgi:hypothetical protein